MRAAILADSMAIAEAPDFLIWSLRSPESSVEVEPAALVGVCRDRRSATAAERRGGYSLLPRGWHTSSATSEHGTWMVKNRAVASRIESKHQTAFLLPGAELLRSAGASVPAGDSPPAATVKSGRIRRRRSMNRRTFLDAASRAALIASWPA